MAGPEAPQRSQHRMRVPRHMALEVVHLHGGTQSPEVGGLHPNPVDASEIQRSPVQVGSSYKFTIPLFMNHQQ